MWYRDLRVCPEPAIPEDLVDHPRYGNRPRTSKDEIPLDAIGHWRYEKNNTFRSTAILADPTRQLDHCFQLDFYADVLETCQACGRPFLFFAEEQKHWYEEMGFILLSWGTRCFPCRLQARLDHEALSRPSQQFAELYGIPEPSDEQLVTLIEAALSLWDQGVLLKKEKLFRIFKIATQRLPDNEATMRLEQKRREILSAENSPS